MAILVTGASGHIGSNLVRRLHQRGIKVVAHDLYPPNPAGVLYDILDKVPFVKGDICDLVHLLHIVNDHNIEGIIHTAVIFGGNVANRVPLSAVRVNIEGTLNVLELARIYKLKRVIYCSTAAVTGAPTDLTKKTKESDMNFPLHGIYAVTKLCCEGLCHNYKSEFGGVDVIVVRPSRVYGPGYHRAEPPIPLEDLVSMVMKGDVILGHGADTPIDYTYVKDIADGLILAYEAKQPNHIIYHMSFGELRDVGQIAIILKEIFPKRKIEIGPGVWGDYTTEGTTQGKSFKMAVRQALDISRAKADLGYNPQYDIDRGLRDYVTWLTERKY